MTITVQIVKTGLFAISSTRVCIDCIDVSALGHGQSVTKTVPDGRHNVELYSFFSHRAVEFEGTGDVLITANRSSGRLMCSGDGIKRLHASNNGR